MDDCRNSSIWRRPTPAWNWTRGRNLDVDVCSTLGRFLPPHLTFVSRPPPPLPPPLLPLAETRRTTTGYHGYLKLERVPTPTRADRLLVAPGDEHDVTVCFQRPDRSCITEVEEVKPVVMSNDSPVCDRQTDSDVISRQRDQDDVRSMVGQTVPMSHGWAAVGSENSRQMAVGDRAVKVLDKVTGQPTRTSSKRSDEEDGNRLTQTADGPLPSAFRRRLPPLSRCRWTSAAAAQRRAVEFDAKYWERRRKNNEAAKRSRDIRRANERRIVMRAALLERENARLRSEVDVLTDDTLRLHYYLLCSRTFSCSHCNHHASE